MAEVKHTPGPWMLNRRGDEIMVAQGPSVGLTLATVTQFVPEHRAQSKANACLMIAAPDYAEVAHDAVNILEQYAAFIRTVKADDLELHYYLPEVERVATSLRAAIAKATGAA